MELKSILSRSALVIAVLIGIFIFFTVRRVNIDHPRPTPRTVEIPEAIRQKFVEPSKKSVEPKPFAAIEHDDPINTIAFSPVDPSLIVTATYRTIALWNLNDTSEPIAVFDGDTAAFSPDGKLLVLAGWKAGASVWHVTEKRYISDFDRFVFCATFSPDGKWVASATKDVKLWDIRSQGRIVPVSKLPNETYLEKLAFSPDGKLLATANRTGDDVTIWDVKAKQVIKTLKQDERWVEAICFAPYHEKSLFAIANNRGSIKLYALPDWHLHTTISTFYGSVYDFTFTPDGKMLLSAGTSEVEFWSVESGRRTAVLEGYSRWANSVALSADGTTLASGGSDRVLRVWHTSQYLDPQQSRSQDIVRLIYFLPSDRAAQPDIPAKLDQLIKEVQQFYADQMEHHGFGRKTFTFEKNEDGSAKVHLVEGQYRDHYYLKETSGKIRKEINEKFDRSKGVQFVVVDISSEGIHRNGENVTGVGGITPVRLNREKDLWGARAGSAAIPASGDGFDWDTIAHELGHTFGLQHDFRDPSYLMSYGEAKKRLSKGSAEWLDKSRFFNPSPPFFNEPTAIEIIGAAVNAPKSKVLRFHLKDADGLHQAMLLILPTTDTPPPGYQTKKDTKENKKNWKKKIRGKSFVLHDSRLLNAQKETIVEFNFPRLTKHRVELLVIDFHGSITLQTFDLHKDITGLVK